MNTTKNTFKLIRALARTMGKTKWFLIGRRIRNLSRQCPMTFLDNRAGDSANQAFQSGKKFDFPDKLTQTVVFGADDKIHGPQDKRMRQILLRAANIKNEPK